MRTAHALPVALPVTLPAALLVALVVLVVGPLAGPAPSASAEPAGRQAAFFAATSPRFDVVLPPDAGAGTVRAGLAAVGALAARYPTASIGLRGADDGVPDVAGDQRVVALGPSTGPVRRTLRTVDGVPSLLLRGRGPDLLAAAAALAGPAGRATPTDGVDGVAVDLGTTGTDLVTAARRAAPVVASLQQGTSRVLPVDLVAPGSLRDGGRSGVLVGATAADAAAVDAPLTLRPAGGPPGIAPGTAYAALQPVEDDGRRLLLLGGWAPDDAEGRRLLDRLLDRVAYTAGTTGWDGRGQEALVVTPGEAPLLLTVPADRASPSDTPSTAASPAPSSAPSTAAPQDGAVGRWWFVGGVVALLVALAGRGLVTVVGQRR